MAAGRRSEWLLLKLELPSVFVAYSEVPVTSGCLEDVLIPNSLGGSKPFRYCLLKKNLFCAAKMVTRIKGCTLSSWAERVLWPFTAEIGLLALAKGVSAVPAPFHANSHTYLTPH